MVGKTYLRYDEGQSAGVLVSPQSLQMAVGVLLPKTVCAVVPCLEAIQVVRLKAGVVEHRLTPSEAKRSATCEVTALQLYSLRTDPSHVGEQEMFEEGYAIAAGYANGHVALFHSDAAVLNGAPSCKWYALGHKPDTQVLSLAMDTQRTLLASGAQDTDITIWDVTSQEASYRLRGHRGGVVAVAFVAKRSNLLVSGSADGWVKVWDLDVRQCVQTMVASDAQVTSLCLDVSGMRVYCGLRDDFIKVYSICSGASSETLLTDHGGLPRKSNKPLTGIKISHDGCFLLAFSSKTIEVFQSLTSEEVRRKVQRKKKRRRVESNEVADDDNDDNDKHAHVQKATPSAGHGHDVDSQHVSTAPESATAAEEWRHLRTFFMDRKVRSADFVPSVLATERESLHLLVSFNDNALTSYMTTITESQIEGASVLTLSELVPRYQLTESGHHSDVRFLSFVDEDSAVVSMGKEGLRLWSVSTANDSEEVDDSTFFAQKESNLLFSKYRNALKCSGSVSVPDITCCAATSSDLCCVGTESGAISLVNVVASEIIASQSVHVGAVKSVACRPDQSGFTSVGSDRRLVVWTLAVMNDKAKTVSLQLTQEIELNEAPLFIEYSPDGKLAAVGLQDNNIQLFFADTMKPFLLLFGHKLPPTSVSFSTDGTLVASVGMDKSLRFWGTDFGDCHRAIHAHDEYVTTVRFVPDTHYVFTCSMDGTVKYWDADNWTMIQKFRFHQRGVWGLAVNTNGSCFASSGVDRCIRLGMRTEEILFPQEEEERLAQEAMDENAARRAAMQKLEDKDAEVGVAGQVTTATTDAAENLMEALDIISVELQRKELEGGAYQPHLLFKNKSVWEHLWGVIESIRPSEIKHAVGSLTSTHVTALLQFLESALEASAVLNFETAAKLVLSLVTPPPGKTQAKAFLSVSGEGVDTNRCIQRLRVLIAQGLQKNADRIDFNVAGLKFLMQQAAQKEKVKFFDLTKIQGHKKKYASSAAHQ